MNLFNNKFLRAIRTTALMLLAGFVLVSCGGGGGGESPPAPASYQGSGLQLGVATDDGTYINVLPGEKISRDVFLSKAVDNINAQLSLNVAVNGVQLLQSGGASSLEINAAILVAGSQLPVTVVAKNLDNSRTESVSFVVNVLSPQAVALGNLTTAASKVASSDGTVGVQVDAGQLTAPVGVIISTAVTPSGATNIHIEFDRDVSGETGIITLLSNQTLLAASLPKSAQAGLSFSPYPISSKIKNYGAYFISAGGHRLASSLNALDLIGRTCEGQSSKTATGICLQYDPQAAVLNSSDLSVLKNSTKEIVPVLFIHGFQKGYQIGGGEGTWNDFPKLVQDLSGKQFEYVPFEFRWRTDAAFSVVADDLADAITQIYSVTGRPVRIIAHSFGGLLTRTLLQGFARSHKTFNRSHVRSVMTIGTPHSGIFDAETVKFGKIFPDGQDHFVFNFCNQISCKQAGEFVLLNDSYAILTEAGSQGELVSNLASSPLPDGLPFVVGIGLSTQLALSNKVCNPNTSDPLKIIDHTNCYRDGDRLISFNGQRFKPELSEVVGGFPVPSKPLLNCDPTYGGNVKEVILDAFDATGEPDVNTRPYSIIPINQTGYGHSAGLSHNYEIAEPYVTCSALIDCPHGSIKLFKSLLEKPQLYCETTLTPPPINTYTLTTNIIGTGNVVSAPSTATATGINCSVGSCTALYNSGATVTLNATPTAGSTFAGWSGGCSGTGSCSVTMNANVTVTATFAATPPPPPTVSTLNDTGITAMQCYQAGSDVLVGCASAGAIALNSAQDGMVGRDANPATNSNADGKLGFSFTAVAEGANPLGCVQDNVTGLMWENKTNDGGLRDWNKTYTNYDSTTSLQKPIIGQVEFVAPTQAEIDAPTNSMGFKNSVNAQSLCGYSDWRLPTADELQSIVDYSVPVPGPTINTNWFPNLSGIMLFWSGSSAGSYAWLVNFFDGNAHGYHTRLNPISVRLVRSNNSGASVPRYAISTDGQEVTDNQTKLIWKRCVEGASWDGTTCSDIASVFTYETALQQATAQANSTGKAWRLPNVKELSSILEKGLPDPSIYTQAFPATPVSSFWTASPYVGSVVNSAAWSINFNGIGSVELSYRIAGQLNARLVRSAP